MGLAELGNALKEADLPVEGLGLEGLRQILIGAFIQQRCSWWGMLLGMIRMLVNLVILLCSTVISGQNILNVLTQHIGPILTCIPISMPTYMLKFHQGRLETCSAAKVDGEPQHIGDDEYDESL